MSAHQLHWHQGQHEIAALAKPTTCACGQACMPNHGRCADCIERALTRADRWQELHRGELDGDSE